MENSIVGVIFTIMMSASMVRDLTAAPIRHLCIQSFVLFLMTTAACFVSNAPPVLALPVNLVMIFILLYAFTYEYVSHLYFPYILSYLFLVFISPVTPEHLPKRLLGVFAGAVCIIVYQLVNGRKRVKNTAKDVLLTMIAQAEECIDCLLCAKGMPQNPDKLREDLCKLSKIVYDRRRKVLCISDASFAMIDTGRGMENLVLTLYEMEGIITPEREIMLRRVSGCLSVLQGFMLHKSEDIPLFDRTEFGPSENAEADQFYNILSYIRSHMLAMIQPEKKKYYRKSLLSLTVRLKAALRVSPVRVVYALRVSCLLAACTLPVQFFGLEHGKWLLFTVASVSLPYADDFGAKAKKRMLATLAGSLFSIILFSIIPSPTGRTIIMMASGYLSFYFTDYLGTFACSTIGALGGAVFMGTFGWGPIGEMILIRIGYISAGIIIGLLANLVFFPFKRVTATKQLLNKYIHTTKLLTKICRKQDIDPQLYYGLVIQAHLQEDKLKQNAKDLHWEGSKEIIEKCRAAVRSAHRIKAA